jgi:molybdopterin converting factor small subunit
MAVTVRIPSYLAGFAEGQSTIEVANGSGNVRDLLRKLWQLHPALKDRVVDEQNEIRQHINIFVAGEAIRLTGNQETRVPEGAEVMIVPAVSGGKPTAEKSPQLVGAEQRHTGDDTDSTDSR